MPKDKSLTKLELLGELARVQKRMVKFENLDLIAASERSAEHKREEAKIRRLATVVRDSNDAVTVQDFEGQITAWNRGAEKMYGYSEEEALRMNIGSLTPPDKEAEQKDFLRRLIAGEKIASFETQRLTKDGRIFDIWMTVTKLVDDAGKPIGIASIERDITERKKEDARRRRLATVVRDSNDAITIQDLEGRIIAWNRGAEKMYGYSESEALQANIGRLTPPDKEAEQKDFLRRLIAGEEITSFETQRLTKDGRLVDVWMVVTKLVDAAGKVIGIASTERDITERKRETEEASRMVTVVRDSNDAITIQDFEGRITAWNRGAEKMYGYSESEALQANIGRLTPPDKVAEQKDFLRRLIAGEEITSFETQRITKDGRILDIWKTVTKLVDDTGKPIGIASTERDITERVRAEALLKQTLEDLKRSNTELEQFAYVASHDLQEPLRMVASYLQLIEKRYKGKLDSDADEFIGYAVNGAMRMKTMINDLLILSRLATRGKDPVQVDCQVVLSTVLTNLGVAIKEKNAEITSDSLPLVKGDETQLVRLFQNLMENAIKFQGEDAPRIHISCKPQNGSYIFSIRDNGIGIDPQYFERVFVVFQRLHGTDRYPGTGIGLAMCKKIVERHRGKIWIESEPGKGTTFYFTLPAA
ncbi:MAG: PAS domain S-box protein [bacterium]|nr:PAS domain S-box protein [bacterium]